ncbi:hypothetical protein AB0J83_40955, partial [Actinoplanes sp. NPDC049596]
QRPAPRQPADSPAPQSPAPAWPSAGKRPDSEGAAHTAQHAGPARADEEAPATPGEQRLGAHAAPYMDPDGTLHNLRPIGKLEVSGPDTQPVRPADTDFGGKWFAPKPDTEDEAPAASSAQHSAAAAPTHSAPATIPTQPGPATVPTPAKAATAAPSAETATAPAPAETATAPAPAETATVPAPAETATVPALAETATVPAPAETAPVKNQPAYEAELPRRDRKAAAIRAVRADDHQDRKADTLRPSQAGDGVVIDLDVTGLFKAMSLATAQPAAAEQKPDQKQPSTPADPEPDNPSDDPPTMDAEAVRRRIEERMLAEARLAEPEPEPEPEPERPSLSAADLQAIRWRLDGGTLREVVEDREALRELGEKLDGPLADEVDNVAKAGLLSVRAEVYRLLGELGMAAAASRLALAHAESAHDLQSMVIAQAELAHILRLRRDFKEADRLFAKATGDEVPETLRSVVHENAGRSCFDQGRHMEALDHFAKAVRLGRPDDSELAARVGVSLEAVYIHVLRDGWGPYPRQREDILGIKQGQPEPPAGATALDEPTAEQPVVQRR